MRWVVGLSGASGARYGITLVRALAEAGEDVALVVGRSASRVLAIEEGVDIDPSAPDVEAIAPGMAERVTGYAIEDVAAPFSSGTHPVGGMIVVPCSMGTLGRIANGVSSNLLERAADVMLKERRKLILVPRETPLSLIHLRNLTSVTEAGAVVLPAAPGFYHRPKEIQDLVDHVVVKILDQLGVPSDRIRRWKGA
ncbi:MAG: UbiX family flavin prenyltransferase [Planctomycetota bacterium]|jgi:4-hydroxy-3-polyprenylbenzoate decarboxylase